MDWGCLLVSLGICLCQFRICPGGATIPPSPYLCLYLYKEKIYIYIVFMHLSPSLFAAGGSTISLPCWKHHTMVVAPSFSMCAWWKHHPCMKHHLSLWWKHHLCLSLVEAPSLSPGGSTISLSWWKHHLSLSLVDAPYACDQVWW